MNRGKLVCIVGANASGKSGLGVELALRFSAEIVSADSRQVFKGLDLGSGKISPDEMRGVRHHLLDVVKPNDFFSMADFQRLAYSAIDDILSRGSRAFLVGGTGLYVASVADGYVLSDIAPNLDYRAHLETFETPELYRMLKEVMPDTDVDANNRNRVMRLLEKLESGDTEPARKERRYDVIKLGVARDRETQKKRIDERLERRVRAGMIDEVRTLIQNGASIEFLKKLGLEYKFITMYLLGEIPSEAEMLEELARAIKKFAKRQNTWFKRDSEIIWLDMAADPISEATAILEKFYSD